MMSRVRWSLKGFGEGNFVKNQCRCKSFTSDETRMVSSDGDCDNAKDKTHFGFSKVFREQKQNLINDVFSKVASKYDVMNDVMSMGIHRLWKDELVNVLQPKLGMNIIDVAGGTGDVAYRVLEKIEASHERNKAASKTIIDEEDNLIVQEDSNTNLVIYDVNLDMLKQGKSKERDYNKFGIVDLHWVEGNAENMPYEDNTFDAYLIAFGIRNCTNIQKVLAEAHRVLKPRGRFLCLEFSAVKTPILSNLYDIYSFNVIPTLGKLVANDSESYQYLVESIRQFPDQDLFRLMMEDTKFRSVSYRELSFGIASIHSGFK